MKSWWLFVQRTYVLNELFLFSSVPVYKTQIKKIYVPKAVKVPVPYEKIVHVEVPKEKIVEVPVPVDVPVPVQVQPVGKLSSSSNKISEQKATSINIKHFLSDGFISLV